MRNYLDLTVFVSPNEDGSYRVRVESVEGQGSSTMTLPVALPRVAVGGTGTARGLGVVAPLLNEAGVAPEHATELGVALFEALFQGDARDVLMRTQAAASKSLDMGVRIRLAVNLSEPHMAAVASLPWELMRLRDKQPLVVSIDTPLVRSLDVAMSTNARPFLAPLRVMVLMSNPRGSAPLDLADERRRIDQSWANLPGVKVDYVQPTQAAVLQALADEDYHVIHYMGHGGFCESGGALLMEDEDGGPQLVGAGALAAWLHDEPLRLVFLNACQSGTTMARAGEHPYAGVATALIREGVPAVLAMQFPISDKAATSFSQTFYQRIAMGFPVDAAVGEGRKMLYSGIDSAQPEWATPVLYLRTKDGVLFEKATLAANRPAAATPTENGEPSKSDPWGEGTGPRIFLASVSEGLDATRRQIASALEARGARIIEGVAAQTAGTYVETVTQLVRSADLVVHLLGAEPGPSGSWSGPDAPLDTLPLEELRIGLDAAHAQLVLLAPEDRESIDSRKYAARIDELAQMPRDKDRLEFQVIDRLRFADAVVARVNALIAARPAAPAPTGSAPAQRIAIVDAHVADSEVGLEVWQYLQDRDVAAELETSSQPTSEALVQLEKTVRRASLYVLIDSKVDQAWVKNRNMAVMRSAVKSRAPILVARYSSDDPAVPVDRSRLSVSALNNGDPGWIDTLFSSDGSAEA